MTKNLQYKPLPSSLSYAISALIRFLAAHANSRPFFGWSSRKFSITQNVFSSKKKAFQLSIFFMMSRQDVQRENRITSAVGKVNRKQFVSALIEGIWKRRLILWTMMNVNRDLQAHRKSILYRTFDFVLYNKKKHQLPINLPTHLTLFNQRKPLKVKSIALTASNAVSDSVCSLSLLPDFSRFTIKLINSYSVAGWRHSSTIGFVQKSKLQIQTIAKKFLHNWKWKVFMVLD